jgi:hypothetical protein
MKIQIVCRSLKFHKYHEDFFQKNTLDLDWQPLAIPRVGDYFDGSIVNEMLPTVMWENFKNADWMVKEVRWIKVNHVIALKIIVSQCN